MNAKNSITNRVDASMQRWRMQELRYAQQYGKDIYQDRDFMKVRATAYRMIFDQHKKQKLGFEERLDLQLLKGQIKQMNERIYPNKYLRMAIGGAKLVSRPLLAVGKLGINLVSYIVTGRPYFKSQRTIAKPTTPVRSISSARLITPAVNGQPVKKELQKNINRPRVLTAEPHQQIIRM